MSASDLQALPLVQTLERILYCWQVKAPTVAQSLQPGLTREQIETQLQTLSFHLPEEVYQLYQWRNGREDRYNPTPQVEFMPGYQMLSLEEAIAEYATIRQLLLEDEEVKENETYLFPLFAEGGNYYVIQGDVEPKATSPVFDFFVQVGLELKFNSLTGMMLAIAECFETGAYSIDDYSYLNWDDLGADQIWFKYQPHRIAKADAILDNAAAILNNQVQHLSDEEQQEAYSALAEMRHPEALPLLIQAVEKLEPEVKHLLFQRHHAPTASEQADAFEALPLKQSNLFSLITGICKIDTIEAIQYLWHLMKRNDAGIRDAVVVRLASFGISESVESVQTTENIELADLLFQILQQSSTWNLELVRLLGELGDVRAVEILLALLQRTISGSFSLRKQVFVESKAFVQINPEFPEWKSLLIVIDTLEKLGASHAVEPLFQLAQQQQDPTIRLTAGKALSALGDPRAREIFTQLLEEGSYTPLHFEQMGLDV
ncbi:HEAT repeat domain-containing protein [Oculatella sp. FACHB-28]|uniref:HEAT repeat domain-containing protein n=1 Tax=Oculatella sp. FACHB-28 TaxID=2692845 RepID=UPI001689462B|nr:HEAT repeat domain-containing protein [Oculatella sp. FACHB-28]MBD2057237.1 HEAT repeat domain-containing protein [Oculatella sp. FACHB-28]